MIINSMIKRVVISGSYSDTEGIELLKEAGIEVTDMDKTAREVLNKVIKLKESWQKMRNE